MKELSNILSENLLKFDHYQKKLAKEFLKIFFTDKNIENYSNHLIECSKKGILNTSIYLSFPEKTNVKKLGKFKDLLFYYVESELLNIFKYSDSNWILYKKSSLKFKDKKNYEYKDLNSILLNMDDLGFKINDFGLLLEVNIIPPCNIPENTKTI